MGYIVITKPAMDRYTARNILKIKRTFFLNYLLVIQKLHFLTTILVKYKSYSRTIKVTSKIETTKPNLKKVLIV